jgi:HD-GYP domain-containing protein (c-di-GMP phosphodiesterase class II)
VIEAEDVDTGRHSRDVVSLVPDVCDELGVAGDARHKAELTALLHDVGKVEIPKRSSASPVRSTPASGR